MNTPTSMKKTHCFSVLFSITSQETALSVGYLYKNNTVRRNASYQGKGSYKPYQ